MFLLLRQGQMEQVLAQKSINATVEDSQFVDPKLIEFAAPQRMQSILNALLGGVPVDGGGTVVTSTDAEGNVEAFWPDGPPPGALTFWQTSP
jgi:hypothetical protein